MNKKENKDWRDDYDWDNMPAEQKEYLKSRVEKGFDPRYLNQKNRATETNEGPVRLATSKQAEEGVDNMNVITSRTLHEGLEKKFNNIWKTQGLFIISIVLLYILVLISI